MGEEVSLRVCLISDELGAGDGRSSASLAELLATDHEVTLIRAGGPRSTGPAVREVAAEPSDELARTAVAGEDHRRSVAVLEAIEDAYGADGPEYLEAPDRGAHALVPLQARRTGHRSLRKTRLGVRLVGAEELTALHDAALADPRMRMLCDLERAQLRLADRLLWPGGDGLDLYRRYYPDPLPEATRIPVPLPLPAEAPVAERHDPGQPLRILYAGFLSRGKGAGDLAEACLRLQRDDWRLTMVGADTETASFRKSMHDSIETMFGRDPRVTIRGPASPEEMGRLIGEHDILVAPSRFDVWPVEVLEAMGRGLPVLATPVGGLAEMVEPGVTGWLTDDVGPAPVRAAIADLLERREELERVREAGAPLERARLLTDPERVLDDYRRLFEELAPRRAPASRAAPAAGTLVTAVVPYFRASDHVREAVDSVFAQTHREVEVIVVNDGSFEPEDEILGTLAERDGVRVVTQLNGGEASARNLGAIMAEGDYLVMLDADNVAEPEFVARALEVFGWDQDLAYVSCWLRFIAEDGSPNPDPSGYAPIGNWAVRDEDENWDGDTFAMVDRRLFAEHGYRYETEAATHTDWELYRRLREDGRYGVVIPERLVRYRVVAGSLMRAFDPDLQTRVWREALDRRVQRQTRWTAEV